MARITRKEFTSSGSWTCPAGVTTVLVFACAGGGGGAGDGDDGGGGGANMLFHCLDVVPNTSYTITIGAGGLGDNSGGTGNTDGGDTTFGALKTWNGAGKGGLSEGAGEGMTVGWINGASGHAGGDEDNQGVVAFPGNIYDGGACVAEAGGGGAGGRGDGADAALTSAGASASANTGAGGAGGTVGEAGGAGGSGYLEIIWSE